MTDQLDLDETRRDYASKRIRSMSPWLARIALAVGSIGGGWFMSIRPFLGPWRWWFIPVIGIAFGVAAHETARLVFILRAARHQRDMARERLIAIKKAATEYSIVGVDAYSVPVNGRSIVEVVVQNRGRGALFAVVIESIDGAEEPLVDPYAPLYWMGRPTVLDEEIPPMESRVVGLGYLTDGATGPLRFTPLSPSSDEHDRSYNLRSGTSTIHFLVSARGIPELSYTRPISVSIRWAGPGNDPRIEGPNSEHARVQRFSPPVTKLLDFRSTDGRTLPEAPHNDRREGRDVC